MKINVILADTGQNDPAGKVHLLGAGWSVTAVQPTGLTPDSAIAVFLEVPWDRCNRELVVVLALINEDGTPVELPMPDGTQPIRFHHNIVVPSVPGAPNGSPGQATILVAIQGGLPLAPGHWYRWQVEVGGQTDPQWHASFFVQRQASAPSFGRTE